MTVEALEIDQARSKLNLGRHRGLIAAAVVFAALLAFVQAISPKGLTYYDISSLMTSGAPLALAAIGQTFVIIVGGFDLSAGAAISLVNAVVATMPQETAAGQVGAVAAGPRRRRCDWGFQRIFRCLSEVAVDRCYALNNVSGPRHYALGPAGSGWIRR